MASKQQTARQPHNNCPCRATPSEQNGHNDCNNGNATISGNNNNNNNEEQQQQTEEHFSYIKRVGSYLVGRTLGEGSFAKVRLGLHLPTAEKVAIKVLDKHRAANDSYMEMTIRREGRLLRRIRPHPNIVQMYEVMETANSLYLVLELCEGGDFLDLVASRGRLTETESRMFLRQIIDAVSHLHSFGILHRDLKIENFMLDSTRQQIKIIDLGLSTQAPGGNVTRTQCGSPAYAAPELIRSPHYGPEVDVWSVGVDMFAMLTGGLPFTVEPFSIKNLYARMMARDMNPLPADTSPEATDLLHRLLEPDPRLRITLQAALSHPWLRSSRRVRYAQDPELKHCVSAPANSIKIVNCLSKNNDGGNDGAVLDLSVATRAAALAGCSLGSLLRDVAAAVPSNFAATYHLLARHAKRVANQQQQQQQQQQPQCSTNGGEGAACPQKRSPSSLSSNSATAIAGRQNGGNLNGGHHKIIVPRAATLAAQRRNECVTSNNNKNSNNQTMPSDLEVSFIANGSTKPAGNVTRVTIAPHSLQRPVKVPMTLTAAATAAVCDRDRHAPVTECRPGVSTESEPLGVQTLERRRLRQPRLITTVSSNGQELDSPNHHRQQADESTNDKDKKSAPDIAFDRNGDIVQTARYLGTAPAPVDMNDGVRWPGDTLGAGPAQCLLTSCCGELPMKTIIPQQTTYCHSTTPGTNNKDGNSSQQQQQRMPSSTPTPPSSMQMSHMVAKAELCPSPRPASSSAKQKNSVKIKQQDLVVDTRANCSENSSNNHNRKQSAIAMFGCVGRDQHFRASSNAGDLTGMGRRKSGDSDCSSVQNGRIGLSKTPPPPVTVLVPVPTCDSGHHNHNHLNNHNGGNNYYSHYSHHNGHQQQNGYQITAASLIVKPAVQAVAAAARRVLCGASPQPGSNNLLMEQSVVVNGRSKQAAV